MIIFVASKICHNMRKKEWFGNWFDSKYYHVLYKNRDHHEAKNFIDNLVAEIKPRKKSKVLDLACGKGRHAKYLSELGYEVTGLDLSKKSIRAARKKENDMLSFYSHDMRYPFRSNYFEYVFNLFTSFGYFETEKENIDALKNVSKGLKKNGVFVLDYFNSKKVIKDLKARETKTVKNIKFNLTRKVSDGFIIKNIRFKDNDKSFKFQEKVSAFDKRKFNSLFKKSGLKPTGYYGDYQMNTFKPSSSPRLIIVAKKA